MVDIVGEPGIGKSRLLHEFRAQVVQGRAHVLAGHCTADSRQTPFRAFIDIVRANFHLASSDDASEIKRKLNEGLRTFGLRSEENVGLLLNLLGHDAPQNALSGLDGVLIGLRTRDLLRRIVQACSRAAALILLFEDVHWLDSASEALLASLVAIEAPVRLLVLHTRRPTYEPPWSDRPGVTRLPLNPLSMRETSRVAQARLGVDRLPEALGKLIAAKAEGNALFAEEIVTYLLESGVVTRDSAGVTFDPTAVTAALPQSIQSILASRVDQLPREARGLLQVAAVIGRRFDPHLVLALSEGRSREGSSFAALEALDLIRREEASGDYLFKHVLVRDALYDGLLSAPRAMLHSKVAEELERRSGDSPFEQAESLAYHFAADTNMEKAFKYLAMAARKSLNVYAIPEAEARFQQALAIFDAEPACADPPLVSRVVVGLLETLMLKSDYRKAGQVAAKYMPLVKQAGESTELVTAHYYRTLSLVQNYELRLAHETMLEALEVAERLGDRRAKAYADAGLLHCRTRLGLDDFDTAERRKAEVVEECLRLGDNFLRNSAYFFVTWDYLYRGLIKNAREIAIRLITSDEENNDPRAIGFANWILGWVNILGGAFDSAIAHADECLRVATAPFDRLQGEIIKAVAAVFSGRAAEGLAQIERLNAEFVRLGALYSVLEGPYGVALCEVGRVADGVRVMRRAIAAREAAGDGAQAAFSRFLLAEVFIRIRSGGRRTSAAVIARSFFTLAGAKLFGARWASALLETAAAHKQFSEDGAVMARINFNRGQLLEMRGRRTEARAFFERARKVAGDQGLDALRKRAEVAVARLA